MAVALPPIDESVIVPAAVKAAAARAEAFYAQPPTSSAQPPTSSAQLTEQTPESPTVVMAEPAQTPEPPAPAPIPEPLPPDALDPRIAQLEAQLAKQQRDYNALLGRNAQQRDYIALQQNQLSQLANPRSWAQPEPPKKPLITDEERKAYGDDALSVMERKALEVVQPLANKLNQTEQALRQELQNVKANDVYSALHEAIPNWQAINQSDEWLGWLRLPDLYSGIVRQQLLDQAFAAGDSGRVLAFFRGFLAESSGHMDQQGQAPSAEPPAPKPPARKATIRLEDLAAPGRAAPSPSSSATAVPPVITNKDVTRFYWEITHGHWNGRDEARAAREAQIHAAVRDGRVQIVK